MFHYANSVQSLFNILIFTCERIVVSNRVLMRSYFFAGRLETVDTQSKVQTIIYRSSERIDFPNNNWPCVYTRIGQPNRHAHICPRVYDASQGPKSAFEYRQRPQVHSHEGGNYLATEWLAGGDSGVPLSLRMHKCVYRMQTLLQFWALKKKSQIHWCFKASE